MEGLERIGEVVIIIVILRGLGGEGGSLHPAKRKADIGRGGGLAAGEARLGKRYWEGDIEKARKVISDVMDGISDDQKTKWHMFRLLGRKMGTSLDAGLGGGGTWLHPNNETTMACCFSS